MFDCKNLLHPFQNDPGTSQRQRIIDYLLSDSVKIDARSLADLLNYFSKLSKGINYYDKELNISNWSPFFTKSLPFLLASISRYDDNSSLEKFELYRSFFKKEPSRAGLQLIIHFIYYNTIYRIDKWYLEIKDSQLPVERTLEDIIRNKLSPLLKKFIALTNSASRWYCTKKIDFSPLLDTAENDVWGLQLHHLYASDEEFKTMGIGYCARLKALYELISSMFFSFLEAIRILKETSEKSIDQSLVPLREELKENHQPHLALIFAFIRLFKRMQDELNAKTKQHLNYFYTEVLKIKPEQAKADKAHIIFELQKILQNQLQKYELVKGTSLNAGRDDKNADIIFETDDQVVVNEAQVADVRSLFLKNETIYGGDFLEGVYIASAANKADGVEKDFKQDPKNWYTVGSKYSKYTEPGRTSPKQHPFGRLGFVLASPVLYLKEGSRLVDITLECQLSNFICTGPADYPDFYDASLIYQRVRGFLFSGIGIPLKYININDQMLEEAVSQGLSTVIAQIIRDRFLLIPNDINECTGEWKYLESEVVESGIWKAFLLGNPLVEAEVSKLPELFKTKYPFKINFSGEKEWIEPSNIETLNLSPLAGNNFTMTLGIRLEADKPAVSFFNKNALKEDLGTELPLVKIELDDSLKIKFYIDGVERDCCLEKVIKEKQHFVSLYHFFRNVIVQPTTRIDVKVCGLKNFIVQNDENVMDVNSIIYPFGTRPKIGSNFYLSANEIFCKNWSEFDLKFNWKDLPPDFKLYYHGYEDKLTGITSDHLANNRFVFQYSFLKDGKWFPYPTPVFPVPPAPPLDATAGAPPFHLLFKSDLNPICINGLNQLYKFTSAAFNAPYQRNNKECFKDVIFRNDTRNNFLRITLLNQDFQHARYSFVLTRQMLALGKFPEVYVGPVYDGIDPVGNVTLPVMTFDDLFKAIEDAYKVAKSLNPRASSLLNKIRNEFFNQGSATPFTVNINTSLAKAAMGDPFPGGNIPPNFVIPDNAIPPLFVGIDLDKIISYLEDPLLKKIKDKIDSIKQIRVVIPQEPYTPQIEGIAIDYKASATLEDIDLIHLYPFTGTYKHVEIELAPTLFPTFCDEGTLFIGLKDLEPGSSLNMLFQLAEATADSETGREEVHWHYLENNAWKPLRTGFEVLEDATLDLTSSGIIKFSLPENMTKTNTVMPANLHWIKASLAKNSRSVSETFNIHTQAIKATFKIAPTNDLTRLDKPLSPSSIEKLLIADPAIKSVSQLYESFGGELAELDSSYYLRVSERLRHKGRAIQKWDYERLVLEEFPVVYRAKCVNHSFQTDAHIYENDVPYAPGYVLLAVIPDLKKLKAGNSLEPRAPVSLLENIEQTIKKITSPFVRLRVSNPRYERVNFCITVRLKRGMDENYFREKLKQDLREFLAPWAVGKYSKLDFGQCINRSDVIQFLERMRYVDFLVKLEMQHESSGKPLSEVSKICPLSPRSILVGGNIDVSTEDEQCPEWCSEPPRNIKCDDPVLVNDYCKKDDVIIT